MMKKNIVFLAAFLSTAIPLQIDAQGAIYDSMNAYQSSKWSKSDWSNGSPFNCGWLPDHISFFDGKMAITLDSIPSHGMPYSSGEYRTVSSFSYGAVEARLKAVKCGGVVTAFFIYDNSTKDEIDLEFLGKNTQQVQTNYFVAGNGNHEHMIDLGFDASSDYHVYKIEWAVTYIKWYVDGILKHSVSAASLPSHPMQNMFSLWNGIGVDSWLGTFGYTGPLHAYYDYFSYTPPGIVDIQATANEPKVTTEPLIYFTDHVLKISLVLNEAGPVFVKLFTLSGKEIARFDYNSCATGNNVFSIFLNGKLEENKLSANAFICNISSKNAKISRKICYFK